MQHNGYANGPTNTGNPTMKPYSAAPSNNGWQRPSTPAAHANQQQQQYPPHNQQNQQYPQIWIRM